ncbi:hypothetical protein N658DRAFT_178514 [Parathielavia hyrcaniae]|uniref:Uncharacterized protein n=1 Tax=Parathielavia hyrcaniae TaxID=113614 RepID=A0AAN6Q6J0_9PEZI|nr:hypothetical protein N658DRAFT_178514 [Parathielavia hyrcaniae]
MYEYSTCVGYCVGLGVELRPNSSPTSELATARVSKYRAWTCIEPSSAFSNPTQIRCASPCGNLAAHPRPRRATHIIRIPMRIQRADTMAQTCQQRLAATFVMEWDSIYGGNVAGAGHCTSSSRRGDPHVTVRGRLPSTANSPPNMPWARYHSRGWTASIPRTPGTHTWIEVRWHPRWTSCWFLFEDGQDIHMQLRPAHP